MPALGLRVSRLVSKAAARVVKRRPEILLTAEVAFVFIVAVKTMPPTQPRIWIFEAVAVSPWLVRGYPLHVSIAGPSVRATKDGDTHYFSTVGPAVPAVHFPLSCVHGNSHPLRTSLTALP